MKEQVKTTTMLWVIFIRLMLFLASLSLLSCAKSEDTFCWSCSMIQRYINEENKIVTWYKDSFTICDRTQEDIYLFEFQNTHWVDSVRYIGSTIECQKQ